MPHDVKQEHHEHARRLAVEFKGLLPPKYIAGQQEHGGELWNKPLGNSMTEEVIDFVIYHLTRRQQDRRICGLCDRMLASGKTDPAALREIVRLLS